MQGSSFGDVLKQVTACSSPSSHQIPTNGIKGSLVRIIGHSSTCMSLLISMEGFLVVQSYEWETAKMSGSFSIKHNSGRLFSCQAYDAEGYLLALLFGRQIVVFDLAKRALLCETFERMSSICEVKRINDKVEIFSSGGHNVECTILWRCKTRDTSSTRLNRVCGFSGNASFVCRVNSDLLVMCTPFHLMVFRYPAECILPTTIMQPLISKAINAPFAAARLSLSSDWSSFSTTELGPFSILLACSDSSLHLFDPHTGSLLLLRTGGFLGKFSRLGRRCMLSVKGLIAFYRLLILFALILFYCLSNSFNIMNALILRSAHDYFSL